MSKPATLSSSLIAPKGAAMPAVTPVSVPVGEGVTVESRPAPSKVQPIKKQVSQPVAAEPAPVPTGQVYYKALTLKLDKQRYMDMKLAGLQQGNKKGQEILTEALDLWLAQHRVVQG